VVRLVATQHPAVVRITRTRVGYVIRPINCGRHTRPFERLLRKLGAVRFGWTASHTWTVDDASERFDGAPIMRIVTALERDGFLVEKAAVNFTLNNKEPCP
jgi:hypothetical protein